MSTYTYTFDPVEYYKPGREFVSAKGARAKVFQISDSEVHLKALSIITGDYTANKIISIGNPTWRPLDEEQGSGSHIHTIALYQGFTETYHYCTECGEKCTT